MGLFRELFIWWGGNTIGTRLFTWRKGTFVGEDEFGNRYYRDKTSTRRWVIYNGLAEASTVSPDWHGWLHHTVELPPSEETYQSKPWQQPHRANMTGTAQADRPSGSTLASGHRPAATGDYEAWKPE